MIAHSVALLALDDSVSIPRTRSVPDWLKVQSTQIDSVAATTTSTAAANKAADRAMVSEKVVESSPRIAKSSAVEWVPSVLTQTSSTPMPSAVHATTTTTTALESVVSFAGTPETLV